MFSAELGSDAKKFLKKADKEIAKGLLGRKKKYSELGLEIIGFSIASSMKKTLFLFQILIREKKLMISSLQ